jgi:F0F1-type ATP synthase membrane subunit b/b'
MITMDPTISTVSSPSALDVLEKGGVLAFSLLVLALLYVWKREQAARDERHEKREERHITAQEKQATATEALATSIASYAAAQSNMALELRDLGSEVRQVRDELRSECETTRPASAREGRRA